MVVAGPNARKDYHFNETEEWFYQLEGNINVRIQEYLNKTVPVAEFYAGQEKNCKIEGVGSIEGIFENIEKAIDTHYA